MYSVYNNVVSTKSFKVILLGNSGVGKSSLLNKLLTDEFDENSPATIGVAYGNFLIKHKEQKPIGIKEKVHKLERDVSLGIWDTAGNEKYKSLTNMYYRGVHLAVVVFDISSVSSLWKSLTYIREYMDHSNNENIYLVGNKSDVKLHTKLSPGSVKETIDKFKKINEIPIEYFEMSVKLDQVKRFSPGISINSSHFKSNISEDFTIKEFFGLIGFHLDTVYTGDSDLPETNPIIRLNKTDSSGYTTIIDSDKKSNCC